jgi:hypothetical protein
MQRHVHPRQSVIKFAALKNLFLKKLNYGRQKHPKEIIN